MIAEKVVEKGSMVTKRQVIKKICLQVRISGFRVQKAFFLVQNEKKSTKNFCS